MRIENDIKLDFKDVLIRPKRSTLTSRNDVQLERSYAFRWAPQKFSGIPIIVANMDHTGTIEMSEALKPFNVGVALHKFYTEPVLAGFFSGANHNPNTWLTIGISQADVEKAFSVYSRLGQLGIDMKYLCIDVANGYTEAFVQRVKELRSIFPTTIIMAGNVVTADMTEALLLAGADIVKIGIGPGSVCTTRKVTGVGFPQLSAIIECADAAHGLGGLICADGGIQNSGDLAKAFGAGADFVMCGGLFAGHSECGGKLEGFKRDLRPDVQIKPAHYDERMDRQLYAYTMSSGTEWVAASPAELPDEFYVSDHRDAKMTFYGMSSAEAMETHYGSQASYRAAEGKRVEVPFKGPVEGTAKELLGGLRSACTYVGAKSLKELSKRTTFVRVSRQLNDMFEG